MGCLTLRCPTRGTAEVRIPTVLFRAPAPASGSPALRVRDGVMINERLQEWGRIQARRVGGWALWVLAIFTNLTAAQRIYYLWRTTTREGDEAARAEQPKQPERPGAQHDE